MTTPGGPEPAGPSSVVGPGADVTDRFGAGMVVVLLLSALAGAVDAYGLFVLKDLFVSFMSGNTTSLGMALGRADLSRAGLIASILLFFVAGAAAGEVLAMRLGRLHLPGIVLFVAALLTLPLLIPSTTIYAMTFSMGALNAALDHAGAVSVSVTYITGTLVKLGRGLARWLCGRTSKLDWLEQAISWLGILAGAFTAALCIAKFGEGTVAALPIVALVMAVALFIVSLRTPKPIR